ncbi:YtcA family lipoprotein [Acidisphaera sp. L21]|uniref:YtcA family lipoprotein n=1 Tax=Acidisphaera sp. L21 TaxID=1641851 RepID=UPI0038D1ED7D
MTASGVAGRAKPSPWPCRSFAGLVPALLCSAGCSKSPSQNIFGSFFPAWILCSAIGIVAGGVVPCLAGRGQAAPLCTRPANRLFSSSSGRHAVHLADLVWAIAGEVRRSAVWHRFHRRDARGCHPRRRVRFAAAGPSPPS